MGFWQIFKFFYLKCEESPHYQRVHVKIYMWNFKIKMQFCPQSTFPSPKSFTSLFLPTLISSPPFLLPITVFSFPFSITYLYINLNPSRKSESLYLLLISTPPPKIPSLSCRPIRMQTIILQKLSISLF